MNEILPNRPNTMRNKAIALRIFNSGSLKPNVIDKSFKKKGLTRTRKDHLRRSSLGSEIQIPGLAEGLKSTKITKVPGCRKLTTTNRKSQFLGQMTEYPANWCFHRSHSSRNATLSLLPCFSESRLPLRCFTNQFAHSSTI